MKASIRHLYEIIAGAILSILGFGACTADNNLEEKYKHNLAEYGQPSATFILKGTVKSEETGESLFGINASLKKFIYTDQKGTKHFLIKDAVSDQDGIVNIKLGDYEFYPDDTMELILQDVDGEENGGLFQTDTLRMNRLSMNKTGEGDGRWYDGEFTIGFEAALKKSNSEQ